MSNFQTDTEYMGWQIQYDPEPTPLKRDWVYWHKDYDGPEDNRCGRCSTFEQCREEIEELES